MTIALPRCAIALAAVLGATITACAPTQEFASAPQVAPDYARVVGEVGPSVVHLSVVHTPSNSEQWYYESRKDPPRGGQGAERSPSRPRRGSGFILSTDGYVVTAGSNVEKADAVTITLADGRRFPATQVGLDKRTDVALLKIEVRGLKAVRFADADKLKTGQRVLLVGAAFAGTATAAEGIISHHSGSGYPETLGGPLLPYVATTVPVHPGNGGGALFDMHGAVVGMVTQVYVTRSGSFAAITFAVPGDVIAGVAESLRTRGYVSRGSIRLIIQEVTRELAQAIGLEEPRGALVHGTDPGGPADRAGIRKGDIILRFNGRPVTRSRDIPMLVGAARPGSRVPVLLWRSGAHIELSVDVEELDPHSLPPTLPPSHR
jgi:serine protease Do